MDTQHPLHPYRATTAFGTDLRIGLLDYRTQLGPQHDSIHLGQEHVAPRGLAMGLESTGLGGRSAAQASSTLCQDGLRFGRAEKIGVSLD